MKCGKCHNSGPEITTAHVRACYGVPATSGAFQVTEPGQQPRMVEVPGLGISVPADGDLVARVDKDIRDGNYVVHSPGTKVHAAAERFIGGNKQTPSGIPQRTPLSALRDEMRKLLKGKARGSKIGYFAVRTGEESVSFYRVKSPLNGKWAGYLFVDVQASDEYYPVRTNYALGEVLRAITADPEGAAKLYADELGCCSICGRTLTNDESRARGIGPECFSKL